ncbi:GntR family transcriptional regulator [Nesterenkonia alba]|uniref:GntR family transcriptional regulator n=1 Tax=Nesterenkonia alba TaxID=515814 RepID=UPI0003B62A91|nr:GntR family transcriptional regulator [Nesterenkonia alba]
MGRLVERTSLRERVTQILREAMVAGELEPGAIYSAPTIAEKLGVSPTPVREAMMELEREGLVTALRHRGYRIKELSDQTLEQILAVRALIEVPTVGRVAEVATAKDVDALRPVADELDRTAAEGEFQAFIAADMTFHLNLLSIAGNDVLVEEVRRLRSLSRLYGLRELKESPILRETAHEHHLILDRVEVHDQRGAEDLMAQHLGHVRGVWAGRPEA